MSKPNAAYAIVDDCPDERPLTAADYIAEPEFAGIRPDFTEAFQLDLDRIAVLAVPFVSALRMVRITHGAHDLAGFQIAMGELAEAAKAFEQINTIASLAERRIAQRRRRDPRARP